MPAIDEIAAIMLTVVCMILFNVHDDSKSIEQTNTACHLLFISVVMTLFSRVHHKMIIAVLASAVSRIAVDIRYKKVDCRRLALIIGLSAVTMLVIKYTFSV